MSIAVQKRNSPTSDPWVDRLLLPLALVVPTLVTWLYLVALDGSPTIWQQAAYATGKVFQFSLPIAALWLLLRRGAPDSPKGKPIARVGWQVDLVVGVGCGLAIAGGMLAAYFLWFKPGGFLPEATTREVAEKVRGIGIDAPWMFAGVGLFYSLVHSGLEEWYWRGFAFDRLRRFAPLGWAIAVSSVAFAAHHVLVMGTYFGYGSTWTWLITAAVAIGGVIWSLQFAWSGRLTGAWLAHGMVDAAIFVVGWDLARTGVG